MERRQADRVSVQAVVGCRVPSTPCLAKILNLSTSGCMVESSEPGIARGATILLRLPGANDVAGQVMWNAGRRFGVKFNVSLADTAVDAILGLENAGRDAGELTDSFGRGLPPLGRMEFEPNYQDPRRRSASNGTGILRNV